ncbi:protein FAR1-RELATED SEQUENCE 5-like [Quercus robur]|uniref:protein FAR1-RELATED SEQUENCE 5-like n=1 Tax=Quercus robur TaxID=38942 RepID=UPI0021638E66|nr:protein FAR1-RELATED SEQUENCE 5-like [Quercus robur]
MDHETENEGKTDFIDLEKHWSTILKKGIDQLIDDQITGLKFSSLDDGGEFYNTYAKLVGFSIRKDEIKRNKDNIVTSRRWVCAKEGLRIRKNESNVNCMSERPITRSGCKAAFRIRFERKLGEWVVGEFKREHNHDLVPQFETQFLRSHRTIKDSDKAQIIALHNVGVKSNQIMDHMIQQAGGYENIGFTSKDLYNYVAAIRNNNTRDGDAECALGYLQAKVDMDSSFFFKYTVDEESRLANLFLTDSQSHLDYACFGDVVAFDTAYKTNVYKKPLVILVGVNHHWQTIVFGFGLLVDETVETYTWVLQNMLVAMNNKTPISVVTDGDKAMSKAIKTVFPKSRHRLCVWHHERNAFANLHDKVYESFIRCMVRYFTPDEFEDMSTQCCEAMNAFLNRFLDRKTRLYELFQQVDRALSRIRHNEMGADFSSNYTEPILITGLAEIEKHAATIFTREVEHLKQIPPTCIMNRWLKTAKSDLPYKLESQMSPDIIRMARFSALSASCCQMCYFGSRTTQGFKELKVEIARLTRRMEELYNSSKEAAEDGIRTASNKANLNVRDPAIVKTKGDHGSTSNNHSHAKVRRCSSCKDVGHTRRTCPSTHIQQGEHVDGDNVPESMEHPAVGSPDLETNYYNFL